MPFNYFNPSHLAFGSKLTRAFRQLEKMCTDAESNINRYLDDLAFLGQYINRNYRIPAPTSAGSPVRADEIFDVLNDEIIIKQISYEDGIFNLGVNYFNRGTDRFTIGQGSTELKEGYAYVKESVSNMNPTQQIMFTDDLLQVKGLYLFAYRIDDDGVINITVDKSTILKIDPLGIDHIKSLRIGQQITLPHTASDYEAILVVGVKSSWGQQYSYKIKVDEKEIFSRGFGEKMSHVVYLKPKQVLSAEYYSKAYKIIYSTEEGE